MLYQLNYIHHVMDCKGTRRLVLALPFLQGQGAAFQGACRPLQEHRDRTGRLLAGRLGVLIEGEGWLVHGDAKENGHGLVSGSRVLGAIVAEAGGDTVLIDRIGGGEGVLVRFLPGKTDQKVHVFVAEPGIGDLAGGSGRILREGPGMLGLKDPGVQESQDIDIDVARVREGVRLIGDQHPPGRRNVVFALVADDGHLCPVVGREDTGGQRAGFDTGIGVCVLLVASGREHQGGDQG